MSYEAHKEEYKGLIIKIQTDDDAESPRSWDNLGTMVCFHSRYNLGDEQPKTDFDDWIASEIGQEKADKIYEKIRKENPNEAFPSRKIHSLYVEGMQEEFEKDKIVLPLYLYDHSGITISTCGFSCPWDSGQVGIIYITRDKIKKEYGWKVLTKKRREKIAHYLVNEVKTYDDYLTGNVFGYVVEDKEENHIDSCWGMYPNHDDKPDYNYPLEEAKSAIDCHIQYEAKKKQERLKTMIKNHVPFEKRI